MIRPLAYTLLLVVVVVCWLVFTYAWLKGYALLLPVEVVDQLRTVELPLDILQQGLFSLPVEIDFPLYERVYEAADWQFSADVSRYFWWFFSFILATCTALMARLGSQGLVAAAIGWLGVPALLPIHVLRLSISFESRYLLIVLLLAHALLLWLVYIRRQQWSAGVSISTLMGWYVLLGLAIEQTAQVPNPIIYALHYVWYIPLLLSIIFVLLISGQIPALLLYLSTRYGGYQSRGNLKHFSFAMCLYLLNVVLLLANNLHWLSSSGWGLPAHLWLSIATVAGFWFMSKHPAWQSFVRYQHNTAKLLYAIGAANLFAVYAYAYYTGEVSLQRALESIYLLAFLFFGLSFWLYIGVNYYKLKPSNLFVSLYTDEQQHTIPNYLARGIAFFGIGLSLYFIQLTPINRLQAGWYALLADAHLLNEQAHLAKAYYIQAQELNQLNPHTYYGLAHLAQQEQQNTEYVSILRYSCDQYPLPQTYLHIARRYLERQLTLETILLLKEGVNHFPKSTYLHNNLAIAYRLFHLSDSCFYHLQQAQQIGADEYVYATNFFGTLIKTPGSSQSFPAHLGKRQDDPALAGVRQLAALRNAYRLDEPFRQEWFKQSHTLSYPQAYYAACYLLGQLNHPDTTALAYIDSLLAKPAWYEHFGQLLNTAKSIFLYYALRHSYDAFQIINTLAHTSHTHSYLAALWHMQHQNYSAATELLSPLAQMGNAKAQLSLAVCLSMQGQQSQARQWWIQLSKQHTTELKSWSAFIESMPEILQATQPADNWTDWQRFAFVYYRNDLAPLELQKHLDNIESPQYRLWAGYRLADRLLQAQQYQKAEQLLKTPKPDLDAPWLYTYYAKLAILHAAYTRQIPLLQKLLTSYEQYLSPEDRPYLYYARALLHEAQNQTEHAETAYRQCLQQLPFFEPAYQGLIALLNQKEQVEEAYAVALRGIRLAPKNLTLLQLYTLQALRMGLDEAAEQSFQELSAQMPPGQYNDFQAIYWQEKAFLEHKRKQP